MDELQCNIVVMKRSQAKVLRLNLVGSPRKEAELPTGPEAASEKHTKGLPVTPISSPELGTPFTSTEAGTSSVSSSDHGTSPFLTLGMSGYMKKDGALVIKENDDNSGSETESENQSLASTSMRFQPPPLCSICQHKGPVFGKPPRVFSYAELELATCGFSRANFLAEGGYGSVHRGVLPEGQVVAVKQHKLASSQGDVEFCSEVEVLSCAQHRNVVMLIGFCIEDGRRLLVYEYICNGSLDSHLYGNVPFHFVLLCGGECFAQYQALIQVAKGRRWSGQHGKRLLLELREVLGIFMKNAELVVLSIETCVLTTSSSLMIMSHWYILLPQFLNNRFFRILKYL